MRNLAVLTVFAALTCVTPAFAGPQTFTLVNGTLQTGSVTGSTVIDTTTGTFVSGDFTAVIGSQTYDFDILTSQTAFDGNTQYYANFQDAAGDVLVLDLPGANLDGYEGGLICSTTARCAGYYGGVAIGAGPINDPATAGTLTPTPEPSSLLLLGTGAVSMAGVARRRFRKA